MNSDAAPRLLLVRHGETEWNRTGLLQGATDIPLNDAGRGQASAAAAWFAEEPPTVLVSSPLVRARETAEIIGREYGIVELAIEPDLAERNYGEAEGLPWRTIEERFPGRAIPGMEAEEDVRERATAVLTRLAGTHPRLVVVAHGAVINSLVRHATADADYPGSATNASVTEFELVDGALRYAGRRTLPEHVPVEA